METSSTSSAPQEGDVNDLPDTITFGSLCFNKKETASDFLVLCPSPNGSVSTVQEDIVVESRKSSEKLQETKGSSSSSSSSSTWFHNLPPQEVLNDVIEWPSVSINPRQNIWACPNFYNEGNTTQDQNFSTMNQDQNFSTMNYVPADNSYGSQLSVNSFNPSSSIYGNSGLNYYPPVVYDLETNNACHGTGYLSPVVLDNGFPYNKQSWNNKTNKYNNSINLALAIPPGSSQELRSFLPGFNYFEMATNPASSEQLRRVLEKGMHIKETMRGVLPSIIQLMTDSNGHHIFEMLIDRCENSDLFEIVKKVSSESGSFLGAALCETGSRSIQRFIKRLKNTGMESCITLILSQFAFELMTHRIAAHIIRQCFLVLGDKPNRVLYDYIFAYFLPLATDPTGCITINSCIDSITGLRRAKLLDLVAKYACHLAYDPSGNFTVQHVIGLQNELITGRICLCLKGQYVQLSQKKGGSHVVEKCLQSDYGRSLVMSEILNSDKALFLLARDQFGNYVIQTALKVTRELDRPMYERLVQLLQPCNPKLVNRVKTQAEKVGSSEVETNFETL